MGWGLQLRRLRLQHLHRALGMCLASTSTLSFFGEADGAREACEVWPSPAAGGSAPAPLCDVQAMKVSPVLRECRRVSPGSAMKTWHQHLEDWQVTPTLPAVLAECQCRFGRGLGSAKCKASWCARCRALHLCSFQNNSCLT